MHLDALPATHNPRTDLGLPDVFDAAPTSMWLEDYSKLHKLFENWRAQGVTDLRRFLNEDRTRIETCSACIRILRVNQRTLSLYAAESFNELSARLGEILRDDTLGPFLNELEQLWQGQSAFESQTVNYTLDGRRLDILLKGVILPDRHKPWDHVLVVVDNVTELESARRKATKSAQYTRSLFEQAPVSLWVEDFSPIKRLLDEVRQQGIVDFRTFTDVHPEFVDRCMSEIQVLDVNRYTLNMFGATDKAELLARLPEVFRDEMRPHFRAQLLELWEGRLMHHREVLNYSLDGSIINIHLQFSVFNGFEHDWSRVLLALTDITARKKAEAYLEYLGTHDVLTKLKNRGFYVDELKRLERKGPLPVTIIAIDLNNLKDTNDRFGHAAGDALLRRTGEVLLKAIDKPFHAARIGGDEFAVLMPGADEHRGETVLNQLQSLLELNNQFYTGPALSFSIGAATCHAEGQLEDTLRQADLAMYDDKRQYYATHLGDRRKK